MNSSSRIGTLMLLDDSDLDRALFKRVIKRSGVVTELVEFRDVDDALACLHERGSLAIDVLLLDINMPRMNGFEFIERATTELGSQFVGGFVVMLTSSLDPVDRERAEAIDIVADFIGKPLSTNALACIAEQLHGTRSARGSTVETVKEPAERSSSE